MQIKTYALLLGILSEAGLLKNNVPDFDKIAEITGHSRDSLKVFLAPKADTPRWVKLLNYVGEKLHKTLPNFSKAESFNQDLSAWDTTITRAQLVDDYENYFGMIHGIDETGEQQINWIMSLLIRLGLAKDDSATQENTEVTC